MTPDQWKALLGAFSQLHHPEVVWIGLPALALLLFMAWQLLRCARALEARRRR